MAREVAHLVEPLLQDRLLEHLAEAVDHGQVVAPHGSQLVEGALRRICIFRAFRFHDEGVHARRWIPRSRNKERTVVV